MTKWHTRLLLGAAVITAALSLTSALHGSGYTERDEAMGVVGDANKRIALTFDDGPHPIYTPEILDILAEYDVKATFFVVGENVRKNPELIERELEEGHEVGNHTYTHPCALAKLSCAKLMDEISECEDAIFETVDFRPHLFRPPGGANTCAVKRACSELGYIEVLWNVDTMDWSAKTSLDSALRTVRTNVKDGSIILFHDYVGRKKPITAQALRVLLPELREAGYEFVYAEELLG